VHQNYVIIVLSLGFV